jgi:hypothetical protein
LSFLDAEIKAYLAKNFPREDIALVETSGDFPVSLGWWVWEKNTHACYSLRELLIIWGSIVEVRKFVKSLKEVNTTYIELHTK